MANKLIVDCSTGNAELSPLTAEEQAQREADIAAAAQAEADAAQAEADDEKAWRDAIANASSVADIKAAILGTGLPAQAAIRRKHR